MDVAAKKHEQTEKQERNVQKRLQREGYVKR